MGSARPYRGRRPYNPRKRGVKRSKARTPRLITADTDGSLAPPPRIVVGPVRVEPQTQLYNQIRGIHRGVRRPILATRPFSYPEIGQCADVVGEHRNVEDLAATPVSRSGET